MIQPVSLTEERWADAAFAGGDAEFIQDHGLFGVDPTLRSEGLAAMVDGAGRTIAACGITIDGSGCGIAWVGFNSRAWRHLLPVVRHCRKALEKVAPSCSGIRTCTTRGNRFAERLCRLLGFEEADVLRVVGVDDGDLCEWVYVPEFWRV